MLDVLLVRIQPTDVVPFNRTDGFEFFSSKDSPGFEVCVSNGEKLQFTISEAYYSGFDTFYQKDKEIRESLNIKYRSDTPLQLTNILIANLGVVLKEKTQGILESSVVTKSNAVQRISRMTQWFC